MHSRPADSLADSPLGSETGEAPGLNLLAAVIGSEGLLGVVVEVTVRLLPLPRRVEPAAARLRRRDVGEVPLQGHVGGAAVPAGRGSDLLSRRAPIGLELGAHAPEEIALSILAEIVAVRNGLPGRR